MTKAVKAFIIDPVERTIAHIEICPKDLEGYYRALDCESLTAADFNNLGDVIYVDDDGLSRGHTCFFLVEGYPQPLAGRGLVVGTDADGNDIEPTVDLAWLQANVDFGVPMAAGDRVLFVGERNIREVQ